VLEIDMRFSRPKAALQLLARNHFAGTLDEHRQYPDGLAL
jgi:hypothetical protein